MNVRLQKGNAAILSRQLKRITALLLAVTFMIVGSGCNMNFYSEKTLQKKALKYMRNKYGNEEPFSVKMAYVEEDTYNIYMDVEDHDGWEVLACWDYGTKEFTDNYMSWVFREQVEEAFYPIFREVYGECKIFNVPYGFQRSNQYNYDTKLEEYLTTIKSSSFDLFTCADPEKKEEDVQEFCENIKARGWDVRVTIIYVSKNAFLEIDRNNYKTYLKNEEYIWYSNARVSKGRENFLDKWRNGVG